MSAQQDYLSFIPDTIFGVPTGLLLIGLGFGVSVIKDKKINQWGGPLTYAGVGIYALKDILPAMHWNQPPPTTCPTGQHLANGVCVPDTITCPTGQHLVNGACIPDVINCPAGFHLANGVCVADPVTCQTGYHLVNNVCVPDTINCPAGYHLANGVCVADTPINCPTGYSLINGVCVVNPTPTPIPNPTPIPPTPAAVGTRVTSLAGLQAAVAAAATGETVVLADGVYDNPTNLNLTGRVGVNIIAERRGVTQIRGAPVSIGSPGLTFCGFDLVYNATGDYIILNGAGIRFCRNRVHLGNNGTSKWIQSNDNDITIDHNEIYGKTTLDTMILIKGNPVADRAKICFNDFHDMVAPQTTPMECIRIGASDVAQVNYHAEVSYNRFENISADIELCTWKCSTISIHHNTMINCDSVHTFRHGSFKLFADNICINTGGLRFFGHNHLIRDNQIIEDSHSQIKGPLVIGGGDAPDDAGAPGLAGPGNALYAQVHDCIIENNMIISNAAQGAVSMILGYGAAQYPPINNTIRNNIIVASRGTLAGTSGNGNWAANTVQGNILFPTGTANIGNMPPTGYSNQNPNLVKMPDGTYNFMANSPLKWTLGTVFLTKGNVGINAP